MSVTLLSVLIGVVGMFGWGMYDFLGGVFAKQIGSFKSLFWSQLAGLISILLLAVVLQAKFNMPLLMLGLSLLAAIVYSFGYLFSAMNTSPRGVEENVPATTESIG